jgi:glycosyltransferase involved in cell wall biosynthesis
VQSLAQRLENTERVRWPGEPVPVALVITDMDVGGAERMLVALATRLNRQRWNPKVICLGPEGKLVEPLIAAGLPPECLDVNRRKPLQAIGRLAASLRGHGPKLLQSFLFHANVAARLAAPLAKVPWVLSGHRVAEHQKRWHLTLDRLTSNLATGSVCVSKGVLHFTRDVEGVSPKRLVVIANGVDTSAFDVAEPVPRGSLGIPERAHLALCIGRLDVQKGLPFLFEAAERVIASCADWHLLLVGDGPERDWVRRRIAETPGLADRVHWVGRRDDVPSLLKAADILVLSSLWEGMPNVVLEAMAARKAVVATNVEGSEDLVIPNESGWLVPPRDAKELSWALLEAVNSPERCQRFGAAGRRRIEADFSIDRMVAAYERLWAGVLGFELNSCD